MPHLVQACANLRVGFAALSAIEPQLWEFPIFPDTFCEYSGMTRAKRNVLTF